MTSRDRRSVGELLLDCEHVAREALMDVDDMHPARMLRTWAEVVESATELWQALPSDTPPDPITGLHTTDGSDTTMDQLQAMATGLHRSTRGRPWPGDGPADERLARISENLTRAADLVTRHVTATRPLGEPARGDLDATKARLVHTLYISAHGVAIALHQHVHDLEVEMATRSRLPAGQSLQQSRAAHTRLRAFEQLAGSYVARTYPGDLAGEHREPAERGRLAQTLASWDVQAHRTLASSTSTADLMMASRIQALIASTGSTLMRAAATTGHIDQEQYQARLAPALDSAQGRWVAMAAMWKDLTPPTQRRIDPALGLVANEVRAALYEIIHDRTTVASPELIAARTDLTHTVQTLQQALSASAELAHVVRDATTDSDLTGAARTVHAIATKINDARNERAIDTSPLAACVSPREHAGVFPL